jgi:hypothetical protein
MNEVEKMYRNANVEDKNINNQLANELLGYLEELKAQIDEN